MKNGSIFTFGVQMCFAMQILSLTPSKKWGERVLEMTNPCTKYFCALLVSHLVIEHNSSGTVNQSPDRNISIQNQK